MKLFASKRTQRLTNFALAAMLVVSTLTASVPFIFSQKANAASAINTTSLPGGWDLSETRTAGSNELVAGGLHVKTVPSTGSYANEFSKAAGYYPVNFPLANVGDPSIDFANFSGVRPSLQLGVDQDGNGTWDGYLVYEPWSYGNGQWWTSKTTFGVPAGAGYPSLGTLAQYEAANPHAKVVSVGYSLGSGVVGDATITKITASDLTFTFDRPLTAPQNLILKDGAQGYATIPAGVVNKSHAPVNAQLSWDAVSGANGYSVKVYKDGAQVGGSSFGWNGSWVGFGDNGFGLHGDGAYTFVACANSTTLSPSEACSSPTAAYIYDSTAPVVSVSPVAGSLLHGTETFNIDVVDANLDAAASHVYVYLYNNAGAQKSQGTTVNLSSGHGTFTVDTTKLDNGLASLDVGRFADAAGNFTGAGDTYFKNYSIDNTLPQITVKTGANYTVGSNGIFSKVSFGLYDNDKVVKYSINGVMHNVTPNQYSDANFITAGNGSGAIYGSNTFVLYDATGNQATYTFVLDNQGPTVTVKSSSTGSNGIYRSADFKLYDQYKVASYSVNGGAMHSVTPNEYSDANGVAVGQNGGVYGANTITVKDVAGNTSAYNFVLDNLAPTITVKPESVGANGVYKNVSFKLFDAYKVASYSVNGGAVHTLTPNQYSDANGIGIGQNGGVAGVNTITVKDLAGNSTSLQFTLDGEAPVITLKASPASIGTDNYFSKVSFAVSDNTFIAGYKINDNAFSPLSLSPYSDVNDITIGSYHHAVAGLNTITVYDIAGNSTTRQFYLDNQGPSAPELIAPTPINGAMLGTGTFLMDWTDSTDNLSGVAYYEYQSSNSADVDQNGELQNVIYKTNQPDHQGPLYASEVESVGTVDGTYYWQVRAIDKAGNIGAWSAVGKVTVDTVAPTAAITSPVNGATFGNGSPVTIEGTTTGATSYTLSIGKTGQTPVATTSGSGDFSSYEWNTAGVPSENYIATLIAKDDAGNATTVERVIAIDNTAPILTIAPQITTAGNQPTIVGTVDDKDATLAATFNGATYPVTNNAGSFSFTAPAPLANGNYPFSVTATDVNGNASTQSANVTVNAAPVTPANTTGSTSAITPIITSPAAAVLGASITNDNNGAADTGVKGATDDKTAAAINSDLNKGTVFGLAWYWWILILAALALIGWWIAAAVRRRNEEQA